MEITKEPKVNAANEFLEIANDFTNPLELVRESISNSFDANATEIHIYFNMVKIDGEDVFEIKIRDNGEGISEPYLENFFDLGNSSRKDDPKTIGEKGHGTKVYFNSRKLALKTVSTDSYIEATMEDIFKHLNNSVLPKYKYSIKSVDEAPFEKGTEITIYGYNQSKLGLFTHNQIKDYIYWKTKFGSVEKEFDFLNNSNAKIFLKGLDWDKEPEELSFGHTFPSESKNSNDLYNEYLNDAPHYFCKRWKKEGHLPNFPHIKYESVFYVEGKHVKYSYNEMLRRQGYKAPEGSYTIQDRYGLWLCKDFIPIQRKNEWIVNKGSEFTKFHAFFNCQGLKLTANRGSIENTLPEILNDIESVVKSIFNEIEESDDYDTLDWLEQEASGFITINKEKKDFDRRKKNSINQRVAYHNNIKLIEPQIESGVFALLTQLLVICPDLFPFEIIDYNTHSGIDLIVKERNKLPYEQSQFYYLEIKNLLEKNFNHSFEYLTSVVCWDTKIRDGQEVTDLQGKNRTFKIIPQSTENDHTLYFLDSERSERKIKVYVLKDYLKEKLNIDFRPRASIK